jgi:transaldolase
MLKLLGFLDGQTTNPSLIAKNPAVRERLERGEKFSQKEILGFYREVVGELASLIPEGSISIEVYADRTTTAEQMMRQGTEMFSWIPNAHIKLPTTAPGLRAAAQAVKQGVRVNMTLCFSQQQAAAVYAATQGARPGDVFISPFVGRLDDRGEDGMALIANIMRLYRQGDSHVQVLTASVRTMDHFMYALKLGSDIITAPYTVLQTWGEHGLELPGPDYQYGAGSLKAIPYADISLRQPWQEHDLFHELTDKGQEKFAADWNALIAA